jgi:hypothetical protein
MQLGSMFISNCNNTLHVSDAICVRNNIHLFMLALYLQHVKNQRLLLQFLSAPEDGRK